MFKIEAVRLIYSKCLYSVIVAGSKRIISNPIFEYFYLFVILINSIFLAFEDPTIIGDQESYK